jgi:hypothetical protein
VDGDGVTMVRVDGSAVVNRVAADGHVYKKRNGQDVDMFSLEAGIDPDNLRNPL